jgi:small subunit ribosomal protein S20
MRERVESNPPEAICCVVTLPERNRRVGVLMSAHSENQHGEGQYKIADLLIQEVASIWGRRRLNGRQGQSQNRVPLDLAGSLAYFFGFSFRIVSGRNFSVTEVDVPRIKSAAKRMRQGRARAIHNRTHRSALRTALRKVRAATGAEATAAYAEAVKLLDRAAQKSIVHKNAAARQKSRLAKLVATKK